MVEALPETSCLFENKIKGVQIIGGIRKFVVVAMVGRPPDHAFLGVRSCEKGFNKLHASEVYFFVAWSPNEPF